MLIPVLVLGFLSIYPQARLTLSNGGWQGSYYVTNYDEVAYSAYVNGIIHGADRTSDPFLHENAPHESLYSIQFIPAFSIAYFA